MTYLVVDGQGMNSGQLSVRPLVFTTFRSCHAVLSDHIVKPSFRTSEFVMESKDGCIKKEI